MKLKSISTPVLIVILLCTSLGARAEFLAFAITKKGEYPLPESIDDLAEHAGKHLVEFRWGEYQGPKLRIGVLEVENQSPMASYEGPEGEEGKVGLERVPVGSIDAMVIDSLVNTGRFTLIEREALQEIMDEQNLKDSGRATHASGASSGKILGARFLVKVVVTHFEPDYKSKNIGLGAITGGALGGVGVGSQKSMVGLIVRLIDPETSEITFTKRVTAVIGKKGFSVLGGKRGRKGAKAGYFSSFSKTPVGNAVIAAVNVGVYELVKAMGNMPLKGVVVGIKDGRVIVNRGTGQVEAGDEFRAYSMGEEFVDPETGLSLGSTKHEIGLLRVTRVMERFCFAEAVGFDPEELVRGDEVVSTEKAPTFEFAPVWEGPFPMMKRKKLDRDGR